MNDSDIIELFWQRNERAIKELSEKYGKSLFKLAFNILGNREDAEECINDTYLRLWNLIPPNKPRSIKAYSFKTTRNLALNKYQKENANKRNKNMTLLLSELEDCIPYPFDAVDDEESYRTLVSEINKYLFTLDKEKQIIFVRRYFYSECTKKISTDLKISENKINVTLYRIRQGLCKHLNNMGVEI